MEQPRHAGAGSYWPLLYVCALYPWRWEDADDANVSFNTRWEFTSPVLRRPRQVSQNWGRHVSSSNPLYSTARVRGTDTGTDTEGKHGSRPGGLEEKRGKRRKEIYGAWRGFPPAGNKSAMQAGILLSVGWVLGV